MVGRPDEPQSKLDRRPGNQNMEEFAGKGLKAFEGTIFEDGKKLLLAEEIVSAPSMRRIRMSS